MISEGLTKALSIGAVVVVGVGVYKIIKMSKNFDKDVALGVDRLVDDRFGNELADAKLELSEAKGESAAIVRAEQMQAEAELNLDPVYTELKTKIKANDAEIKALKANLKTAESSGTSVAVGSGDSAVAVQVKDNAAINEIKMKIANLEAENVANKERMHITNKTVMDTIRKGRTDDTKLIFSRVNDAERKVNSVKFRKETYKNDILNDQDMMFSIRKEAYKKYYNPKNVYTVAGLYTIAYCVALYLVWDWAIAAVKTYKSLEV